MLKIYETQICTMLFIEDFFSDTIGRSYCVTRLLLFSINGDIMGIAVALNHYGISVVERSQTNHFSILSLIMEFPIFLQMVVALEKDFV